MSASAPLGSPSRKTGSDEAVVTIATSVADVVRLVMSQAAATSLAHMDTLDAAHTSHSMRNVPLRNGDQADGGGFGCCGVAAS